MTVTDEEYEFVSLIRQLSESKQAVFFDYMRSVAKGDAELPVTDAEIRHMIEVLDARAREIDEATTTTLK